jgi:type III pantothenate kinase
VILVDVGNSRLKWTTLLDGDLSPVTALSYVEIEQPAEHTPVDVFQNLVTEQQPAKIVLVHVQGDDFETQIQDWCKVHNVTLQIVHSNDAAYGVTNSYSQPENLGADRFVALVAAHHLSQRHLTDHKNSIVVDCGTAVTFDALSQKGEHIGGLIVPGLQLWGDSLIKNTELLESVNLNQPKLFATNTGDAIGGGSVYGLAGTIDGICERMEKKLSHAANRILCGGDAKRLLPYLKGDYQYYPELVLLGLKIISENKNA